MKRIFQPEYGCTCVVETYSSFYVYDRSCQSTVLSQEERTKLREGVPCVKLYRYNPKHLYPKFDGYGDIEHRKVRVCLVSAYYTVRDVIFVVSAVAFLRYR